jgi:Domain of unknown function (DUF4476)
MKKIFTLLTASFLSVSVFAIGRNYNKLTISFAGSNAKVTVDDRLYTSLNSNSVSINDLWEGYHTIKVFKTERNNRGRAWGEQVIYAASVFVKPGYHVDVLVNRFGKALIDERNMNDRDYFDDEEDYNYRDNRRDDDYRYNRNNRKEEARFYPPMNNEMFARAKQSVQTENFDNSKLSMAKQILDNNSITALQVKQLAETFSFNGYKLDFAKYAYDRTIDKQNYFLVYDVFSMGTNKNELAEYIRTRR